MIKYDHQRNRYELSEEDVTEMIKYGVDPKKFTEVTGRIISDINLRPFQKKLPLHRKFVLYLAAILVFMLYIYFSFILLQLALFNLILLGIIIIYMGKLYNQMTKIAFKYDYNYRNAAFQKHIKKANDEYFLNKNVELVGLKEGLWLELQLPDNEDNTLGPDAFRGSSSVAYRKQTAGEPLPSFGNKGGPGYSKAITERPEGEEDEK